VNKLLATARIEKGKTMLENVSFNGFNHKTLDFFSELRVNNDVDWFKRHKDEYERFVLEPARSFVEALGNRMQELAPGIIADPRINQSLFRINRDTRFSKDKTPYKTHLAIWLWEGTKKRMECSGFYFHLEPDKLFIGAGIYMFEKEYLEEYRKSVVHEKYGPQLETIIASLQATVKGSGGCALYPGERFKKVPRGYDPNHKNADLLLNKGLTAFTEEPISDVLFSPELIEYVYVRFDKMAPLHRWLSALVERV
jgi:uncharacterized protein (TIGR02453 family)